MTETNHRLKKLLPACLLFLFILLDQEPVCAEAQALIPVGRTVGITLNMKGVTIVDTADVEGCDGARCTPAQDAGIKPGDVITEINGGQIESAQQLEELVNRQGGAPLRITFIRDGREHACQAQAALSDADGRYRLGVWIRDAASGIGTVTYVDPETGTFGALGHGISESADQEAMPIQSGSLLKASIVSVQKGGKGQPGELIGVFAEDRERLGTVQRNTAVGVQGVLDGTASLETDRDPMPTAARTEVQEGPAEILSNIEGDKVEAFAIEIQKLNKDTTSAKGMVIKVTDPTLLEKTGGIVQGM